MNAEILGSMLELQHSLNVTTIGDDWRKLGLAWQIAITQEAAEGIDHLGWPWWKKSELNITAAQMEVVDILHFALSYEMAQIGEARFDSIAEMLANELNTCSRVCYIGGTRYDYGRLTPIEQFHLLQALAFLRRNEIPLIFSLANNLGLSDEAFCTLYRAKATLNLFRQHRGYKEGAYIKRWPIGNGGGGFAIGEDNDVLQDLQESIDWSKPEASNFLYAELDRYYTDYVIPNAQK